MWGNRNHLWYVMLGCMVVSSMVPNVMVTPLIARLALHVHCPKLKLPTQFLVLQCLPSAPPVRLLLVEGWATQWWLMVGGAPLRSVGSHWQAPVLTSSPGLPVAPARVVPAPNFPQCPIRPCLLLVEGRRMCFKLVPLRLWEARAYSLLASVSVTF